MIDIIKIFVIFIFILFLLRKKINIGYALIAGALLFVILYPFNFNKTLHALFNSLISHTTLNLLFSLTLIKSFEYSLRQTGLMQKMTSATQTLVSNKKFSIISMPLIIGMLPSLGGAYLSAPMVDSATRNTPISKEEKAFINYWYRHPWELILPLYPGIVLASAVSGVSLRDLILLNFPIAVIFFTIGFLLSMENLKNEKKSIKSQDIYNSLLSFIPILLVLLPVIIFKIDLSITLFLNILFLCFYFKKNLKETFSILKYGFTLDVIVLVFGVMIFKEMLQLSGAVDGIAKAITDAQIPYLIIFITLPFFVGLITGISVGFVGSTFPILLHLKETLSYEISIAFVSGYAGVLLSPLHLCLILTKDYFKADILGIYKKILPATLIIFFVALIEYFFLRYYN
jgi:integral membrane protein (TIGR00529 family)